MRQLFATIVTLGSAGLLACSGTETPPDGGAQVPPEAPMDAGAVMPPDAGAAVSLIWW